MDSVLLTALLASAGANILLIAHAARLRREARQAGARAFLARVEADKAVRALQQVQGGYASALETAETDSLTGLPNRHAWERVREEARRLAVQGREIALLLVDLDNFKSLNDTEGHEAGDRALKRLAALLKRCTRPVDFVFRWGGEEFGVLLAPGTARTGALAVAERIRAAAEAELPRTVSIGVALSPPLAFDRLFQEADQALYAAKRAGRNRVETARGCERPEAGAARLVWGQAVGGGGGT